MRGREREGGCCGGGRCKEGGMSRRWAQCGLAEMKDNSVTEAPAGREPVRGGALRLVPERCCNGRSGR